MATLEFLASSAKDTENLATDNTTASENGISLDAKKGTLTVAAGSTLESGSVIDVSNSDNADGTSFYKTVSVNGGYEGALEIIGSGAIANTFYAGGGNTTLFGGSKVTNSKNKDVMSADKFYGGAGADVFLYEANAGKDAIYNYTNTDEVQDKVVIQGLTSTQSLSFVDKSGGLTITISDSADEKSGTTAKNSVLTIDGKTATATNGFIISDGENDTVYGKMPEGVSYGTKSNKTDTSTLVIGEEASGDVNVGLISSTVKNISASNTLEAVNITGNGNANAITIGAAGGTIDGGYGAKATADKLYGTASAAVTFVYDAINGGKDVIGGDKKNTAFDFKSGDSIVLTNSASATDASLGWSGVNAILKIDNNNTLTISNAMGKEIIIYDEEGEEFLTNSDYVLPSGLNYADAKASKITADNAVITAGEPTSTKTVYVETIVGGETLYRRETINVYETIALGGDNATYRDEVKEIDLSTSGAPVFIDTSEENHSTVTVVRVGTVDSTVIASETNGQTFYADTAGSGEDLFIIDSAKVTGLDNPAKAKADTIYNLGEGDQISIDGATDANLTFVEKGKDLNINVGGYTIVTVKNYDSSTGVTVLSEDLTGGSKSYPKTISGVSYADKKGKVDKTGLVAAGSVGASLLSAADFGDTAIKTIDASAVTAVSGNRGFEIDGSSVANTIYAPNSSTTIATTINGGAGNDVLTSGKGATTFVFEAQTGGKKDTINNYKTGDVIIVDTEKNDISGIDIGEGEITYDGAKEGFNGFNDSKSDVVITLNAKNSITVKNAAGKAIQIQDGIDGDVYTFGHVLPAGLAYDAKNTTVTLAADNTAKTQEVVLSDTSVYYSTVKNVNFASETIASSIVGNTLANEIRVGDGGSTVDTGAPDDENEKFKPAADKVYGGAGKDYFIYDVGYGKDQFFNFSSEDGVVFASNISRDDITITDKKNVVTVALTNGDNETKGAITSTANSTFTITKDSATTPIHFYTLDDDDKPTELFTYGSLPSAGVTLDEKSYSTLTLSSDAPGSRIYAANINSQIKTIDARTSTGNNVLVGNANASAIYGGTGSTSLFGGTAGTKAVKDALYGGSGKDYFFFTSQDGAKGKETDIVYNYQAGDVVVLDREPDSVKADGKTLTLTFNDLDSKEKTVASTLVINGAAQDATMKKFDAVTSDTQVTFTIGFSIADDGTISIDEDAETATYTFDTTALKKGGDWGTTGMNEVTADSSEELPVESYQLPSDELFDVAVSTDGASELESILDAKSATNYSVDQLFGDSAFTNIGSVDGEKLAAYSARRDAKK